MALDAVSICSVGRLLLVCVRVRVCLGKEFHLLSLTVAQVKKYERPLIVRRRLVSLAFEEKICWGEGFWKYILPTGENWLEALLGGNDRGSFSR